MAALFVGGVVGGYAYTQDPGVPSLLLVLIVVVLALLVLHVFGFHQSGEASYVSEDPIFDSLLEVAPGLAQLAQVVHMNVMDAENAARPSNLKVASTCGPPAGNNTGTRGALLDRVFSRCSPRISKRGTVSHNQW